LTTKYYWNFPPKLTGWIRPCLWGRDTGWKPLRWTVDETSKDDIFMLFYHNIQLIKMTQGRIQRGRSPL